MALSLKRWIAAALLGCAGLAVALLPPEVELPADLSRVAARNVVAPAQIARAVRADYEALFYLSRRDDALRIARGGARTPVVLIDPRLRSLRRPTVSPARVAAFVATFDSTVRTLAPLDTGVRLIVFATRETTFTAPVVGGGLAFYYTAYVLPGATDGRTCMVIVPLGSRTETSPLELGPCAFYAAFGRPGERVLTWLRNTRYLSALGSDWLGARERERFRVRELLQYMSVLESWNAIGYVGLAPDAAACAAGRLRRCRPSLDATPPWVQARPHGSPTPDVVRGYGLWSGLEQQWFLADLVRTMGRQRFAGFWRSPLSRDSAFAAAFGTPIEEWTHRWIADRRPGVHVGSAIRLSSALLGVAFALLLLTGGAYYTTRRQIG